MQLSFFLGSSVVDFVQQTNTYVNLASSSWRKRMQKLSLTFKWNYWPTGKNTSNVRKHEIMEVSGRVYIFGLIADQKAHYLCLRSAQSSVELRASGVC